MDGASKFVRGDAVAGLIITCINIFGGIIIGYFRHGMPIGEAADVFVKLSVGDGLVAQMPALIVSLAAGLLVSRGGTTGSTDQAVVNQLSGYPRALSVSAVLMFILALMPGLPFIPFVVLGGLLAFGAWFIPRQVEAENMLRREQEEKKVVQNKELEKDSVKAVLRTSKSSSHSARWSRRACSAPTRSSPSALARCARSSPRNTASSCPRSR